MATEYPEDNISGIGLRRFAELLAASTSGALRALCFFDGAVTSRAALDAVQGGVYTGADAYTTAMSLIDPTFAAPSFPFPSRAPSAAATRDEPSLDLVRSALRRQRVEPLYMTRWPAIGLWTRRPVLRVDDLLALSVRTNDAIGARIFAAAGCRARFVSFHDGLRHVASGHLDAFVSSGDGSAGRQIAEFLPTFLPIDFSLPISATFVRQEAFDALSDRMREQVREAARKTEACQHRLAFLRAEERERRLSDCGVIVDRAGARLVADYLASSAAGIIDELRASFA